MTQNKGKTIIGITGNSGSGKTTVASMTGGHVIEADAVAHRVMEPGKSAYKKIIAAFGPEIVDSGENHKIDRKILGAIVFNSVEKRTILENIVHPLVTEEILAEAAKAESDIVAIDAVLLVESGLHKHCDALWLVTAPEAVRRERIITRDNLAEEAAEARMRNQRDTTQIADIANNIITNSGDLSSLESQIKVLINDFQNQ